MMKNEDLIRSLNERFEGCSPEEVIKWFVENYKGKIALSSSLGAEDQVLTDMVARIDKDVKIFTLDTGRLFYETYDLIEKTSLRYKIKLAVYFPNPSRVEAMVNKKGINLL